MGNNIYIKKSFHLETLLAIFLFSFYNIYYIFLYHKRKLLFPFGNFLYCRVSVWKLFVSVWKLILIKFDFLTKKWYNNDTKRNKIPLIYVRKLLFKSEVNSNENQKNLQTFNGGVSCRLWLRAIAGSTRHCRPTTTKLGLWGQF